MKKNKIILSFDIEEFDLPTEFATAVTEEEKYRVSVAGATALVELLERHSDVKVTFFTTANFASHASDLLRRMAARHEIASHGCDHSSFRNSDLAESRRILQKLSGQEITGFRMARLAQVEPEEILKAGYSYESSKNPTFLPGRYNNLGLPTHPYREQCGLWQLPISVVPLCRFPLFWLSFKNLPLGCYTLLAKFSMAHTGFFNMYSHPWEYNAEAAEKRWHIPGYITRHAGKEQLARLDKLLNELGKNGEFVTFSEFVSTLKD